MEQKLKQDLWAYYPVKGSLADSSGNNHTLTLNNGAELTYDIFGNDKSAIDFNGISAYATIPDGTTFDSQEFSVTLFVMPRENKGLFFGKQDFNTAKGATFNVGLDNVYYGFKPRFSITYNQTNICNEYADGSFVVQNSIPFQLNAWYQITITYSKGTMKLFTNGRISDSTMVENPDLTYCSSAPFILGAWWANGDNFLNGKLDNDPNLYQSHH